VVVAEVDETGTLRRLDGRSEPSFDAEWGLSMPGETARRWRRGNVHFPRSFIHNSDVMNELSVFYKMSFVSRHFLPITLLVRTRPVVPRAGMLT
jgi:hypothetical protein